MTTKAEHNRKMHEDTDHPVEGLVSFCTRIMDSAEVTSDLFQYEGDRGFSFPCIVCKHKYRDRELCVPCAHFAC